MACDICGKTGKPVTDLRDCYKTDDIQQVCDACTAIIEKQLRKVQNLTTKIHFGLMLQFLRQLKVKP